MADFLPSQPPELFRQDPYLLRWYNELVKRVGADSYTKEELDAGVLDARYYTESELDSGALDGRYYTESEVNALLVKSSSLKTSNYTLTDDDYIIECQGSFTLTLHTPAAVSEYILNNSGAGNVSIIGAIQGDINPTLYPNESFNITWTGSKFILS